MFAFELFFKHVLLTVASDLLAAIHESALPLLMSFLLNVLLSGTSHSSFMLLTGFSVVHKFSVIHNA